ncbi:hypothetical protein LSM04_006059 [Trypanosoma melophagium]|uniref:uncharacterized protein n=1 Tax=Trypanosoma melophagium TaxID=715481 RepID=UPI003519F257|nr:hypothetical protein LSM04_006059 [Trypanosoma melophagium]
MASRHSDQPTSQKEKRGTPRSNDTDSVFGSRRESAVREYIRSLPSVFEGDASPPLVDEMMRMEIELAQLDHDGLKRTVLSSTQRCNDALHELLEQERLLSDALAEVRHLELRLREKDEEMEMLHVQLQASDDHIESLLREKADALRKLTDAKSELARVSRKAANLQRDLDAKTKREKELNESLVSTPRTTAADTTRVSVHSLPTTSADQNGETCRPSVEHDAKVKVESSPELQVKTDASDRIPLRARRTTTKTTTTTTATTTATRAAAAGIAIAGGTAVSGTTTGRGSGVDVDSQKREGEVQGSPLAQVEGGVCPHCCEKNNSPYSNNVERTEWRKLFFESQRQNKFLEKELAKARAHSTGETSGVDAVSQSTKPHIRTLTQDLQTRLRRSMAELERVERELGVERERGRKQSQLEVQLLKDVGSLARKLRAHENAKSALRAQQRADATLSREELLEELGRYRVAVNASTAAPTDGNVNSNMNSNSNDKANTNNNNNTSSNNINGGLVGVTAEADITADLAAALQEALAVNETLRAEKDCVLADKRMREAAYEAELRNRIAEMDELTAALHELRDQMKLLRQQRPLTTTNISSKENEVGERGSSSTPAGREVKGGKNAVADAVQQKEMPLHILSPDKNSKFRKVDKGNDDSGAS